ncbi:putative elongator complex protein 2 [Hypsizygus marmoreus]|uniref:Elongator complex protein 2 n=1 Tax=Hypsizygus marmoreus TaxID=39966 RepID=A0A369JQC9_HYPMA|nr:putative elongator complex protein 2 [Hypsizygus marmoreus]
MEIMATSTAYIAASTNRHAQAADISTSSLAAFGSSNLIALWDIAGEEDRGVSETLPGHEGLVTSVRFISDEMFVSADDKGTLITWRKLGSQAGMLRTSLQAHTKAVSSVCVLDDWVVSGSSDASVKVWRVIPVDDVSDELFEEQILLLRGKYPLSLKFAYLPQSKVAILAVGGTDCNVNIYARSDVHFVHASVLSGHEDWVKCLDFSIPASEGQPLILASGSQDSTIRLWTIEHWSKDPRPQQTHSAENLSDELLDAFEASLGDVGEAEEGGRQISLKRHILTVKSDQGSPQQYSITFDALLVGHEAGVTSVAWNSTSTESIPTLLSTSTDSSLILWSPSCSVTPSSDGTSAMWINRQRFGDIGGQRLGGFVGSAWANDGNDALAWGWAGGWRRWSRTGAPGKPHEEFWTEAGAISGHHGPVKGFDWSPTGSYLISAGSDQTTRIHGALPSKHPNKPSWHEISRPQVHGYDLLDVAFIDPLRFVSIADEKVARVFEAPGGFVELAKALGVATFSESESNRPLGASVPPLGLSNKATEDLQPQSLARETLKRRPFEGELASITLWPEIEKVFGHGYESITLAVSPHKRFMATACKATTAEHAVVRIYDTTKYQLVGQPLEGHSLTVTRIAFSPDEKFVLSVSRDRSWRLFEAQDGVGFIPVAADKSHGRIIWDCAWAAEGDIFATASRDKTVKIWHRVGAKHWKAAETIKTGAAATAVAFAPGSVHHRQALSALTLNWRRLAIGLESGEILVYSNVSTPTTEWRLDITMSSSTRSTCANVYGHRIAHVNQVHRLAWQPTEAPLALASCSEDGTLKILIVQMAIE